MSITAFLACIYFLFTVFLLFKKKHIGNVHILFGGLTYLFVIGYSYMPKVPKQLQSVAIFIIFSVMIIIFGMMNGILAKVFKKSDKVSEIVTVVSSILLIAILFNIKGYLTYMYIPVLLVMIQRRINKSINKHYENLV